MNVVAAIAQVVIVEMIRRKDFYVLFVLTALITLLMGSVNIFNDHDIVRYLKEICLLLIWISSLVIAIGMTARQVPAEKESRTLFPLLAKPVTRGQLLLGKWLGCWLACGLALVVFYLFFGAVAASREHTWPLASYGQALFLHWAALAIVVALTLAGSIVFAAPSSTVTITFVVVAGILFVGGHLDQVALRMGGLGGNGLYVLYFAIPHLELFANVRDLIIHDWPLVPWLPWLGALAYAAAYTAFFLGLAWLLPAKKIPGVGKRTAEELRNLGVIFASDILKLPLPFWNKKFGKWGLRLFEKAQGIDNSPIEPCSDPKSISAEETFSHDVDTFPELEKMLMAQAEDVGRDLRKHGLQGRTVTLKIKFSDFKTVTRSRTLTEPVDSTQTLFNVGRQLLRDLNLPQKVRLIGIGISNFSCGFKQMKICSARETTKQQHVDKALDHIQVRFGKDAIKRGRLFDTEL